MQAALERISVARRSIGSPLGGRCQLHAQMLTGYEILKPYVRESCPHCSLCHRLSWTLVHNVPT